MIIFKNFFLLWVPTGYIYCTFIPYCCAYIRACALGLGLPFSKEIGLFLLFMVSGVRSNCVNPRDCVVKVLLVLSCSLLTILKHCLIHEKRFSYLGEPKFLK